MEELLGLRVRRGVLTVCPRLPAAWPGFEAAYHSGKAVLRILVRRGENAGLYLDGEPVGEGVPLSALEGDHELLTILPDRGVDKEAQS